MFNIETWRKIQLFFYQIGYWTRSFPQKEMQIPHIWVWGLQKWEHLCVSTSPPQKNSSNLSVSDLWKNSDEKVKDEAKILFQILPSHKKVPDR